MKSNVEWREWGRRDPLWGVASWPGRQRGGASPWTEDEFYATGAADWADYRSHWEHYGLDSACCLEIGCGAGRLTKAISGDFRSVHAVDVSEEILELARSRVATPSVTFYLTDGLQLPLPDASVTAVISTFVFQHLDDPRSAVAYLREIRRVMDRDATFMIQLPLFAFPLAPALFRTLYGMQRRLADARANIRRRLIARGGAPFMRGLKYEIVWVRRVLAEVGFRDVQIRMFEVRSNGDFHSFVLARRADAQ